MAQADTIIPPGVQGLDRYAYVNNSPMNFVDPSGHVPQCDGDGWCGDNNSEYAGGDANLGGSIDEDDANPPTLEDFNDDGGCQFSGDLGYLCQLPEDAQDQVMDQIINSDGEFHPIVVDETAAMVFDIEVYVLTTLVAGELLPLVLAGVLESATAGAVAKVIGYIVGGVQVVTPYEFESTPGTQVGDIIIRINSNEPATRGLVQSTEYVFRDEKLIATYDTFIGVTYGP